MLTLADGSASDGEGGSRCSAWSPESTTPSVSSAGRSSGASGTEELGAGVSDLPNFDWYHPLCALRHTEDEVLEWCSDAELELVHLDVIESGNSLRARQPD